MFAALNAFIIPIVYLFFPETAGRSLEGKRLHLRPRFRARSDWIRADTDMDIIFALAHNEGVSPVKVSLRKDLPLAGSPEADEILGLTQRRDRSATTINEKRDQSET